MNAEEYNADYSFYREDWFHGIINYFPNKNEPTMTLPIIPNAEYFIICLKSGQQYSVEGIRVDDDSDWELISSTVDIKNFNGLMYYFMQAPGFYFYKLRLKEGIVNPRPAVLMNASVNTYADVSVSVIPCIFFDENTVIKLESDSTSAIKYTYSRNNTDSEFKMYGNFFKHDALGDKTIGELVEDTNTRYIKYYTQTFNDNEIYKNSTDRTVLRLALQYLEDGAAVSNGIRFYSYGSLFETVTSANDTKVSVNNPITDATFALLLKALSNQSAKGLEYKPYERQYGYRLPVIHHLISPAPVGVTNKLTVISKPLRVRKNGTSDPLVFIESFGKKGILFCNCFTKVGSEIPKMIYNINVDGTTAGNRYFNCSPGHIVLFDSDNPTIRSVTIGQENETSKVAYDGNEIFFLDTSLYGTITVKK